MRRFLLSALAVCLFGGVASADRYHGDRGHDRGYRDRGRSERVVVRDHRYATRSTRYVERSRPIHYSGGYYSFYGGRRIAYSRPIIRSHYYDVRVRPQVIVENYQPVTGYNWVAGGWQWDGREWQWTSGHYEIAAGYNFYDDGGYEYNGTYYPGY